MTRRFVFQPVMSAFVLVSLVILLGLGTWQMKRLDWKTNLIARMEERGDLPPRPFPARIMDASELDHRAVTLSGDWVPDIAFTAPGGVRAGAMGDLHYGVLRRAEGAAVLVNLGFSADGPPEALPSMPLSGIARIPPSPNPFTPDNDPSAGIFYWLDLPLMANQAGVSELAPLVVHLTETPLRPAPPARDLRNPHLGYAITWYGLAAALIGVYIAASLKRQKRED